MHTGIGRRAPVQGRKLRRGHHQPSDPPLPTGARAPDVVVHSCHPEPLTSTRPRPPQHARRPAPTSMRTPSAQADGYAFLAKCFKECSRVLAPGGTLVINMCTHEQHQQGYWWFKLMPKACAAYCATSPPIDLCLEYLRNARLNVDPGGSPRSTQLQRDARSYPACDSSRRDLHASRRDSDERGDLPAQARARRRVRQGVPRRRLGIRQCAPANATALDAAC